MKKEQITTKLVLLIADEGMTLTNGYNITEKVYVHVDAVEEWKEIPKDGAHLPKSKPTEDEKEKAKQKLFVLQIASLPDTEAVKVKELYPSWADKIGESVEVGEKLYYDEGLYKVRQGHIVQKEFAPSADTASLYEEINETHKGTLDDPIPYNNNMRLELGRFYSQNGEKYKCTRDSEIAVFQDLTELVGIYVVAM